MANARSRLSCLVVLLLPLPGRLLREANTRSGCGERAMRGEHRGGGGINFRLGELERGGREKQREKQRKRQGGGADAEWER